MKIPSPTGRLSDSQPDLQNIPLSKQQFERLLFNLFTKVAPYGKFRFSKRLIIVKAMIDAIERTIKDIGEGW